MNKNIYTLALAVVAIVLATFSFFKPTNQVGRFGSITGTTTYNTLGVSGLAVGSACNNSLGTCNATTISQIYSGTCNIHTGTGITTIAATTTVNLDCQAGSGVATALSNVPAWNPGDRVFITQPTTTPTTNEGIQVISANGSTTAGFISLKVANYTGATYTITSSATSSLQYLYLR